MFGVVRLIIGSIFLGSAILLISKLIKKHRILLYIISIVLSAVLVAALAFLPFENLYTTFETPEEAYEYFNFGKSDIQLVVKGTKSDLIIDNKNGTNRYLIIPKSGDGWKIGIGANTRRVIQKLHNGIVIYVYQYKATDDFFITVLDTNGGSAIIADSYNSEFYAIEKINHTIGKVFVTYYAHISGWDNQYWISINDTKIEFAH